MKTYLFFIVFLFFSFIAFSQSKKDLQQQVASLTAEKQKLIEDKQKLMEDNLNLKQQILDIKTENLNIKSENAKLKTSVVTNNDESTNNSNAVPAEQSSSTSQTRERCLAITAKGTQCTRLADPGSKYCWQHKATYEPNNITQTRSSVSTTSKPSTTTKVSSGTSSSGRTLITGPRGGTYYINKNGNKTYVKKK